MIYIRNIVYRIQIIIKEPAYTPVYSLKLKDAAAFLQDRHN